jgi:hypothetical protein
MAISQEDAVLIKNLYLSKGYGARRLLREFPDKMWTWGVVKQRVYEKRVYNVDELKQRLSEVWPGMNQNVISSAISEWRKRLRACVQAQGRHFEYLLQPRKL